jgi:O-antigen/teichoic acid export membrane protein
MVDTQDRFPVLPERGLGPIRRGHCMSVEAAGSQKSDRGPGGVCDRDYFGTSALSGQLRSQAVRGGAFMIASQTVGHVIRMAARILLARLLMPEDFGLVAMVAALTGLMLIFSDLGLGQATVQREKISHEQVSTLFWINAAFGLLVSLVFVALAPALVWFYHEPRLLWITIALAGGFLFAGLTIQHQALLQRQLEMGALSIINIFVAVISVVVSIGALLLGAGVWAIVAGILSESIAKAAAVWFACRWRPGFPRTLGGVRSMIAFGGNLTGSSVLGYVAAMSGNVLVGKAFGAVALGLYSRAYDLLLMPLRQVIMPVSSVAISTLSRLQNEPQRYRRYFMRALVLIAMLIVPPIVYVTVMSKEVIVAVLGIRWVEASALFSIMGIAGVVQPYMATQYWLLVSTGKTKRVFRISVATAILTVGSYFAGLPFGTEGVAIAFTVCNLLVFVPSFAYACRGTPVSLRDILAVTGYPFAAVGAMAAALWGYKAMAGDFAGSFAGIGISFVGAMVIYYGLICMKAGSLEPVTHIFDLVRELKGSRVEDESEAI